jgi:hypothetical protein
LPGHYIEPNLGFFYWLQTLLEDSIYALSQNGILNETYSVKFKDMKALVNKLTQIVEYKAGDRAITEQQNTMIAEVPFKLVEIILPVMPGGYIMDMQPDMFEMPLIADVHTDSQVGEVLEVATGIPYRLFIALNDRHGGKRITVGYTYSYYEFTQPIHNRLNDNEWKKQVYGESRELDLKIPEWASGITCE